MLLVKELIALKRCKETYLRQATNVPKMTKDDVMNVKHENLVRYNRTFEVFKTMRGTSSYYQQSKKNLMAMLRQKGCPTLFVTIYIPQPNSCHYPRDVCDKLDRKSPKRGKNAK